MRLEEGGHWEGCTRGSSGRPETGVVRRPGTRPSSRPHQGSRGGRAGAEERGNQGPRRREAGKKKNQTRDPTPTDRGPVTHVLPLLPEERSVGTLGSGDL